MLITPESQRVKGNQESCVVLDVPKQGFECFQGVSDFKMFSVNISIH